MIDTVDEDKSGEIEFAEFLQIIEMSDANEKPDSEKTTQEIKSAVINQFFKDMSNGTGNFKASKDLSFNLIVQKIRRGYMMDAILGTGEKREHGNRILTNVGRQVL